MARVQISGDRFGNDGRVKEEVTIDFNRVEGTLFITCQGRKTVKSYSVALREVQQLLLPLLAQGYVNLMIPPVGDAEQSLTREALQQKPLGELRQIADEAGIERAPIIPPGPGRPGGPETGASLSEVPPG